MELGAMNNMYISINTTPGKMEMNSKPAKLYMDIEPSQVKIDFRFVKIEIDQSEAFASAGLKNNEAFRDEWVRWAYQKVLEGIARINNEGDALAAIKNKGNTIAAIAESKTAQTYDWRMDFIPKVGPKFSIVPGTGEVHFQASNSNEGIHNGVNIEVSNPELNITYIPSTLDINVKYYKKSFYDKGYMFDSYV